MEESSTPWPETGHGAQHPYFRVIYLLVISSLFFLFHAQSAPGAGAGERSPSRTPKISHHTTLASAGISITPVRKTKSDRFNRIISGAADRYKVEMALIKAVIMAESAYNPKAVSSKGAKGLMQLMPRTARALGVKNAFNPTHNINGGVKYLRQLLDSFKGDMKLALAAYNAGSSKVRRHGGIPPIKATRTYVRKVFAYYQHYKLESASETKKV